MENRRDSRYWLSAVGYRLSAICWTLSAIRCLLSAGRLFTDESSASPVTLALHHRRAGGNPQLSGPKTLKPESIKNLGPVIHSPMNPLHLQGAAPPFSPRECLWYPVYDRK